MTSYSYENMIERYHQLELIELGTRLVLAEDDYLPADGAWWAGGDNIRASERGLIDAHRCHICGDEGGH